MNKLFDSLGLITGRYVLAGKFEIHNSIVLVSGCFNANNNLLVTTVCQHE
jgi:hypothetical protein